MEKDDHPLSPAVTRQLQRQIEIQDVKANIGTLLRYATTYDYVVLSILAVAAIAGGAALPVMSIAFGRLAGVLNDAYSGVLDQHDLNDKTVNTVLYLIYLAIGEFFTVALSTAGFMHFGERISCGIREQFVKACLRQNIGFYDTIQTGELTTRITADTNLLQDGISEKLGLAFAALATFVSALVSSAPTSRSSFLSSIA
ncbi:P-loop containing nucleoside triphosphate hydrolase [Penicillium frequentans]|uniref:P-loop containing nucleoside triphosphate hydrolase n=1 Tax=Penicillium frequentans TaxID=3151616 RepID=A0AAD6CWA2_9EURO|nr:P-loop containing nucleoside triphosphate hydrolase [Penicillium glabrum]